MKTYKFFIIIFFSALISCESKYEGIKGEWKYYGGFHFGDFLYLDDENIQLKDDTIFYKRVPFAIIEEYKTTYFPGAENKLTIKEIETGKSGFYTYKGK